MGMAESCDKTHLYLFSFPFHKHLYEIWFQITQLLLRKTSFYFENFEIWMTLTFDTHLTSWTHWLNASSEF